MSDLIIVKVKDGINVEADMMRYWRNNIIEQKETGVILLPWFLTAIAVPEDTEIKIESEEQDPCDTCEYEEGSIYCKEHCPHEAVNYQETVTEFADRCRECGAKYGKLLKQKQKGGVMTYGNGEMPNGGWTPVSEGTPKENQTVIASTKYGVYPEARYTKEYGWEWAADYMRLIWRELEDVEAWMPLPKRYEPQIESEV